MALKAFMASVIPSKVMVTLCVMICNPHQNSSAVRSFWCSLCTLVKPEQYVTKAGWVWYHISVNPGLGGRQKQEDRHKFKACLGYIATSRLAWDHVLKTHTHMHARTQSKQNFPILCFGNKSNLHFYKDFVLKTELLLSYNKKALNWHEEVESMHT